VQGLEAAHEDLRLPREVDLTTDGELLVVSSAVSGRPLAKFPPAAIERLDVDRGSALTTEANKRVAGLSGMENLLVLQVRSGNGVPVALAEHPIVFASPDDKDVGTRLPSVKNLLVARSPQEMARLERGERRLYASYTIGILVLVALVVALLVGLFLVFAAPRQSNGYITPAQILAAIRA
jgi:hypothetical protein